MITKLLNTLMLSASVSLGATNNFNSDLKPNKAQEQNQVAYIETTESTNYKIKKLIKGSHTIDQDTYIEYRVQEESKTSTTTSDPNTYLLINQKTTIIQGLTTKNNNNQTGKIAGTTRTNKKIITAYKQTYLQETDYTRYPVIHYIFQEITPTNANNNLSITIETGEEINLTPVESLTNNANIGWKYTIYITTTKLDNEEWTSINQIQEEQRYTGKLIQGIDDYGRYTGQTLTGMELYNIQFNLVANTKNYIYIWGQPTFIFTEENNYTRAGVATQGQAIENQQIPTNTNEEITSNQEIYTETLIRGVNTPLGSYEVVDIGGLTFTILGMPFTFISTAFNLTLFPGTPYQVNISTLFLSVFAVIVFVFIVKMILGAIGNK